LLEVELIIKNIHEAEMRIVGLPNVGKSTLFHAITRAGIVAEN